jgi:hypothetical protein
LFFHRKIAVDSLHESWHKGCNEAENKGTLQMPSKKPTVFVVTDIETTLKKRVAFDVAWQAIDRSGRIYGSGSYVIREAFRVDVPFFAEKLGHYFDDAFSHLIRPASITEVRDNYNSQVSDLQSAGHRVILCAYNAAFDFKYLPETFAALTGESLPWMKHKTEVLDIWDYWGESVPQHYAQSAAASASGKYVSTSAESAYKFEFLKPDFVERHIAWSDVQIESDILLRALSRKKKLPVVSSPKQFAGAVWKKINTRLGIDGNQLLPQAQELVGA